ncbi:hypothetical protein D3C85_1713600 [compost metagenome]
MQENLPVLAHDMPVTREVLDEAGLLRPLDATAWAKAVALILSDKHLKESLS